MSTFSMVRFVQAGNPLAVSLLAYLFVTFVGACLARWFARYGIGVAVALAWCMAIGAFASFVIAVAWHVCRFVIKALVQTHESIVAVLSSLLRCTLSAGVAGLLAGSVVFAMVAPKRIDNVNVRGAWFEVKTAQGNNVADALEASTAMLALAAGLGACSGLTFLLRQLQLSTLEHVAAASIACAAFLGALPIPLIAIWLYGFAPKTGAENMLGLLPISVLLWCGLLASIGFVIGLVLALLRVWFLHSQTNALSRLILWAVSVLGVLYITEVGLHGLLLTL